MTRNSTNFINPNGENIEEVKEIFKASTNLLIEFLASASNNPLLPNNQLLKNTTFKLPQSAATQEVLLKELETITSQSMNPANPSYIGHMDSMPTVYSIIGSLYSAALNNNMFSLEMSPYFTRLEYALTKEFSSLFGLPKSSTGVIVSGGSLANIQAIITARNFHLKSNDGDISKSKKPLVLFASIHSHVSIKKAAMICGIGIDNLIYVNADSDGKMDLEDLKIKIKDSKLKGQDAFAVVATLGTTVTGNIDPIEGIAKVCEDENLWLHADAIYGGAIILSKKEKHRLNGIEKANSISFNPQKWMHISKTCSLLLFRDSEILNQYFSMKAHYTKEQDDYVNLSEINIQGTKHAEVLKLWLSIMSVGMSGYEKLIDESYVITKSFVEKLNKIPNLEFASEQEMNIPTFRLLANEEQNSDALNNSFNEFALKEYNIFFSLPRYCNKLWQRTILLNPFIDETTIQKVVTAIEHFNEQHLPKLRK